jgi:hypothetical protein
MGVGYVDELSQEGFIDGISRESLLGGHPGRLPTELTRLCRTSRATYGHGLPLAVASSLQPYPASTDVDTAPLQHKAAHVFFIR